MSVLMFYSHVFLSSGNLSSPSCEFSELLRPLVTDALPRGLLADLAAHTYLQRGHLFTQVVTNATLVRYSPAHVLFRKGRRMNYRCLVSLG